MAFSGETLCEDPSDDVVSAGGGPAISRELVAERVLLSALREQDSADHAEAARQRAHFLAEASLRFGASLDEELTYSAIAGLELPGLDAWCIVDIIETGGLLRRLAVVHSANDKHVVARTLAERWVPDADDPIGVPAVRRTQNCVIVEENADEVLAAAVRDANTSRIVRELGIGTLLVVPIMLRGGLIGSITFVGRSHTLVYSPDDLELAGALALRCAQALESARLYAAARTAWREAAAATADAEVARAEADTARGVAETANLAKASFLSTMSHELRTPLNAIGGYAQLMEMGIHGPVSPEQASDLASIQRSQQHLLGLVDSVLHYAQVQAGTLRYFIETVPIARLLDDVQAFVAPQMRAKGLTYADVEGDVDTLVAVDVAKVRQILVNLLGNATKFTPDGGTITLTTFAMPPATAGADGATSAMSAIRVADTGPGIEQDKLSTIFEPFVQLGRQLSSTNVGVGLGLSISRELACGMGGDLTVESVMGKGTAFTLIVPAARAAGRTSDVRSAPPVRA